MKNAVKPLMGIVLFALTFFSSSLLAKEKEDEEVEEFRTLDQMLGSLKLEKKQAETMVDTMIRSGRISVDEGARAKREIASIKETDFEKIKSEAIGRLKSHIADSK